MMKKKKIMHVVNCVQMVMIVLMISACGNKSNPAKEAVKTEEHEKNTEEVVTTTKKPEKKEEVTTIEEETTVKTIDYEKLVTDAYHEKIGESDLSIPKINLEGDGIKRINEEIWTKCYDEQVKSEMDGNGIGKTMSYTS